jgi:thioredoxin 1
MSAPKVIHTTDASFESEVLRSDRPTIVDFWAQWCGPCRAISPAFLDLAERFGNDVKVAMVNVDENPLISSQYGVTTLPTLTLFKGGRALESIPGATDRIMLEALFERARDENDS